MPPPVRWISGSARGEVCSCGLQNPCIREYEAERLMLQVRGGDFFALPLRLRAVPVERSGQAPWRTWDCCKLCCDAHPTSEKGQEHVCNRRARLVSSSTYSCRSCCLPKNSA